MAPGSIDQSKHPVEQSFRRKTRGRRPISVSIEVAWCPPRKSMSIGKRPLSRPPAYQTDVQIDIQNPRRTLALAGFSFFYLNSVHSLHSLPPASYMYKLCGVFLSLTLAIRHLTPPPWFDCGARQHSYIRTPTHRDGGPRLRVCLCAPLARLSSALIRSIDRCCGTPSPLSHPFTPAVRSNSRGWTSCGRAS